MAPATPARPARQDNPRDGQAQPPSLQADGPRNAPALDRGRLFIRPGVLPYAPGGSTAPAGRPGVDRQNFVSNPQFFPDLRKFSDLRILRQLFYKKSFLLQILAKIFTKR
jgi:hypothetical protein